MYICICHNVTTSELLNKIKQNRCGVSKLIQDKEIATQCKKCVPEIKKIAKELQEWAN